MKLKDLRKNLKNDFAKSDIDEMDADFIIAEVLNQPVTMLALIDEVDNEQYEKILKFVTLRKQHIPVNKIFKRTCFYGLDFKINNFVLAPRQESELLVETALKYIRANNYKDVLDLCTGSGCLAISIKKNADVNMTASDVSTKAINVATANAKKNQVDIKFVISDMFENLNGKFDLIVTNPPYIATDDIEDLDDEVKKCDPKLALDGGDFGLNYYKIIHDNLRKFLNVNGIIIMEIGEDQRMMIESLFNDFELIETKNDYNDIERVLVFKK